MPSIRSVSQSSATSTQGGAVKRQLLRVDQRRCVVDGTDDGRLELNVQFQAFIEVVLSIYLNSWYSRLTPRDRSLVPTINGTIYDFTRSLVSAIESNDVTIFLLLRLPTILAHHARLFRLAIDQANTSLATAGTDENSEQRLARSYHALASHLGVVEVNDVVPDTERTSALYAISPLYLTVLTEQLLVAHLPLADSKSDLERSLLREIIAKAVLGGTCRRLVEPWFWWKVGLSVLGEPTPRVERPPDDIHQFSMRAMIHGSILLVNRMSSVLLAVIKAVQTLATSYRSAPPPSDRHTLDPWLLLGGELLRVESRSRTSAVVWGFLTDACQMGGPVFDRVLPDLVQTHILNPGFIARSIGKLNAILYPNGQPAPDTPDPSAEESADLRERLERRLLELFPPAIRYGLMGGTTDEQASAVHDMLSPFANRDINVHLVIVLLDGLAALMETYN